VTVPLPPSDLHSRNPKIVSIPIGSDLHRFYTATYEPVFFDRSTRGRFNAPNGSFGVLYVARLINGAFAETFLRSPGNTSRHRILETQGLCPSQDDLAAKID
jgi:hypothetical protein